MAITRRASLVSALSGQVLASGIIVASLAVGSTGERLAGSSFPAADIDRFLAAAVPELGGGCALLVVRDGKVLYQSSFGSVDVGKSIRIASATKWLTGAVLLSLVDEGKLGLDDPASRYLPGLGGDKAGITVRHLLSHTSGLPMTHPALDRRDISLREAVDAIAAAPLMSAPGQICVYGDASIQVAGRIAEIASGRSWTALFTSKISVPLGMTHTSCEGFESTSNPHLAGGAVSTAGDYANFLVMLLGKGEYLGRRVLSRSAVEEMFRDQTRGSPLRFNPFEFFAELHPEWRKVRYGICTWLEVFDGATGTVLEASAPGVFGFCPWIDIRRNLAGVFVAQTGMEKALPAYLKLKALIRKGIPV